MKAGKSRKTGNTQIEQSLSLAIKGINEYLNDNKDHIRDEIFESAKKNVPEKLTAWLRDPIIDVLSPNAKKGIVNAIEQKRWGNIVDAFLDEIAFGTGGIRGIAAFATRKDETELERLFSEGIQAAILKGPNTINDLVLIIKSAGVGNYAREHGLKKIVIGYDSRAQGRQFAELITRVFLAYGMTVYLFDEACPYPELTFAIPHLKADMGILISASHNDRRYNGYKLSSSTGAQFEKSERDIIYYHYIKSVEFKDIKILEKISPNDENLFFLGGDRPIPNNEYYGREQNVIDMHKAHLEHIQNFILDLDMLNLWAPKTHIGYSAYHGAGRIAMPALLKHFHFNKLKIISSLNELDGRFPCFSLEQQPDPGDNIAAEIAVNEFKKEYGNEEFNKLDLLIGTDPDADRAGFIVKIPENQKLCYQQINQKPESLVNTLKSAINNYKDRDDYNWHLLDADNAWTLLLWYRLKKEAENNQGIAPNAEQKFISLSHTTSDSIVSLVRKHGLGVIKTWVGFAFLANSVYMAWDDRNVSGELQNWIKSKPEPRTGNPEEDLSKKLFDGQAHPILFDVIDMESGKRNFNYAALEQSNGFSILGSKPEHSQIWGQGGHVRDKDGTFAAILIAEIQAFAKSQGKTIIELLDENIYLDPDIGLFVGYYEPEPYWGQFEGPTGMSLKINMLKEVENLRDGFMQKNELFFAGHKTLAIEAYRTGKYDALHRWQEFPDEGIRFFFDEEQYSHLTIRPSGTSQCLRFHVQLKAQDVNEGNLYDKKKESYQKAREIVAEARKMVGA